jgi:hypothetical protein
MLGPSSKIGALASIVGEGSMTRAVRMLAAAVLLAGVALALGGTVGAKAPPPKNTAPPTISGTAQQGQTLTASVGNWTGQVTAYAYQWLRCNASGAGCAPIGGATASTYVLAAADVGFTIRVAVTASSTSGSATAQSTQTGVVQPPPTPPANTSPPTISGTAQDGQTLTAGTGTWTGTAPIAYAYQWLRCDGSGANCAALAGATASGYVVASADVGSTLRVAVTASNAGGSTSARSSQTAVVVAAPPANTSPPTISGIAQDGQTLTAGAGTWSGTPPLSFAYQWLHCDTSGAACVTIIGATATTYALTMADDGFTMRVAVTATNSAGSASAQSAATAVVVEPGTADPVVAAAGDIACDPSSSSFNGGLGTSSSCRQLYTSNLIVGGGLAGVLVLGDNQYYCGSLTAFQQVYDPTWGRVKSITYPSPGNHEYLTSGGTGCDASNAGAAGYFNYFGAVAAGGWFSVDIGTWHIISLDSNCSDAGGCGTTSPQGQWLQSDLAAHTNMCTLAFWHIPLFSSGGRAASNSQPFWNLLYAAHADVILNGHDHIYERFAPQDPSGNYDPTNGIREFIVGTGGADHTSIATVAANSEVRDTTTYGVLELTLHPTSYDWTFVPDTGSGSFTDSGSASCH